MVTTKWTLRFDFIYNCTYLLKICQRRKAKPRSVYLWDLRLMYLCSPLGEWVSVIFVYVSPERPTRTRECPEESAECEWAVCSLKKRCCFSLFCYLVDGRKYAKAFALSRSSFLPTSLPPAHFSSPLFVVTWNVLKAAALFLPIVYCTFK